MRTLKSTLVWTLGGLLIPGAALASDLPHFSLSSNLVSLTQDDDEGLDEDDDLDDDLDEGLDDLDDAPAADPDAGEAPKEADIPDAESGEQVGESLGGATGFVFPTGFYISSDLGGFVRFGGYGDSRDGGGCLRCVPKLTSNLQPWVGVNIGYDIFPFLGVEMTLGNGFIADASPVGYAIAIGEPEPAGVRDSPENSAVTMVNFALTGTFYFLDRLALTGKGFVGGALLSPDPDPSKLNLVRGLTCDAGFWGAPSPSRDCGGEFGSDFGISFGAGMGLRYATLLTDVVIGFDANVYGVFSPNVGTAHTGALKNGETYLIPPFSLGGPIPIIPAFSFAPVIKYVF